jgi:hypothetical protein
MADPAAAMKAGAPPAEFKLYDRSARRPDDIAEATTREGKKVKYIVRWERGTINRAIYEIAFLHEPGTPLPDAWTITVGWNGRLVFIFGGGIKAGFHQGNPFSAVDDLFLSRGYAVATSSLNVFGNNCDDVISAETMEMVKEHFIKRFGIPVHTIGWGASGGSMQQHLIAQNYPGLLDGIIVMNSFPDITSVVPGVVDCSLLAHAFDAAKQPWTDEQKTSVSGFVSWGTCAKESKGSSWIKRHYSPNLVQPIACNAVIQPGLVYAPGSNPKGARCDIYDNEITVYGRDPKTGFARRPLDNIGVQYGLLAFNSGKISAEQFLELNEKIGGYDHDGNIVPARMAADPEALHIAYATGRVNTGSGGLRSIPIIDLRTYEDSLPDIHDELRSFVTRARLMAANGRADNHVMFTVPFAVPGKKLSPLTHEQLKASLTFMDQWLGNILKDNSPHSTIEKIVSGKPAQLVDTCWTEEGEKIAEKRTYDGNGRCNQLYPPHAEPRMAAGEPLTDDVLKCTLKPIDPKDYLHPLREEQLTRLKAVFPQGVCDFSRPGTGQVSVQGAWRKY